VKNFREGVLFRRGLIKAGGDERRKERGERREERGERRNIWEDYGEFSF
jgi:hypothetical protein